MPSRASEFGLWFLLLLLVAFLLISFILPNQILAQTGVIKGNVSEEGTGNPIPDLQVDVYDRITYNYIGSAVTDASGTYTMPGLATGSYMVCFNWIRSLNYIPECYDNATDWDSATPIPVTTGSETAGINAQLTQGGTIKGTVSEEGTGNPIPDLQVDVYDSLTFIYKGSAETDASGNYTVSGLATGSYRVCFNKTMFLNYVPECYNNASATDLNSATPIPVTTGSETAGINAQLAQGGTIKGTVTEEGIGNPIPNLVVRSYDSLSLNPISYVVTDASGNYTMSGLATGSYMVCFNWVRSLNYIPECYDNATDWDSATPIPVTTTSEASGINAQLSQGSTIKGTVTEEGTGNPITDLQVDVYLYDSLTFIYKGSVDTDASGNYTVSGLATGSYKVCFNWGHSLNYIPECYDNATDLDSAIPIPITTGSETTGIDAQLARDRHPSFLPLIRNGN